MNGAETQSDLSRQQRLARHYLMDDVASGRLKDTIELAAHALGFPHAQVNVLDDALQYTISDYHAGGARAIPRANSMCHFTVSADGVLAVPDLRIDPRSRNLPGVRAGAASSYLGVALHSRESDPVGTLCFFDSDPRVITDEQLERTRQFGAIVEDQLELMRRAREQHLLHQTASADLVQALGRGEIVPWFQPLVDLRTDRVVGYEALARWERPGAPTESPARFLPQAEDSDLVIDLDRAVVEQALARFASWGRRGLRLNLNLSTRHLEIPDGVSAVHELVLASGVSPEDIDLELTETRRLDDESTGPAAVAQLRDLGYQVLLDDFGNGWSSLDWLLRLPVHGIKVDRAVTAALGRPTGDAISRAIITMARELDLAVVVEGISTVEHVRLVRSQGYRWAQGYYWSSPVPAADVRFD